MAATKSSSGPLAVMCNSAKFKRIEAQELVFLISLSLLAVAEVIFLVFKAQAEAMTKQITRMTVNLIFNMLVWFGFN